MTGINLAGLRVESGRRKQLAARHPLGDASLETKRSTLIRSQLAAGATMAEIAEVMRCSVRTLQLDLRYPPITLRREDADAA